jgi:hypothetical protein
MEIRTFKPYFVLIGLMILTSLALAFTVDVKLSDTPGIQMELPPGMDGGWVGDELRYSHDKENPRQFLISQLELPDIDPETGDRLHKMSLAEYDALPHDTQFIKSVYTNALDQSVFVSIVLSGKERNSIHRPQRCLVGQGNSILETKYIQVPLEGRNPLKVCVLDTAQRYRDENGEVQEHYGYYAYWFVGQGRETPSHYERMFWLAWDRVVHSVAHKWAYIAVSGSRENEESEDYLTEIREFVALLYPHLLMDINEDG